MNNIMKVVEQKKRKNQALSKSEMRKLETYMQQPVMTNLSANGARLILPRFVVEMFNTHGIKTQDDLDLDIRFQILLKKHNNVVTNMLAEYIDVLDREGKYDIKNHMDNIEHMMLYKEAYYKIMSRRDKISVQKSKKRYSLKNVFSFFNKFFKLGGM